MSNPEEIFDLKIGQICQDKAKKVTHRSRWYTEYGERVGYGDLSIDDFRKIASKLNSKKLFIVLPESSSEWDDTSVKSVDHLAQHALYVITSSTMLSVERHPRVKNSPIFNFVNKKELRELLHSCVNN